MQPVSLVSEGRVISHNIYRTATLCERELALVKGRDSDQFPQVIPTEPWDGSGLLPDCDKSLANGDNVSEDRWQSLQVWHAGLSCQLFLRPSQVILSSQGDDNFVSEFRDKKRQNVTNESGEFRRLLVYELRRGTVIPHAIGIEQDGEDHVCLFPIGVNLSVSDIDDGLSSFTIDALKPLVASWKPYAVLEVRASGFEFPSNFPSDVDYVFPFRCWLSTIIKYGSSDFAMDASRYTEDYISGGLTIFEYFSQMLCIARKFLYDCDVEHIVMNRCVLRALKFSLNANLLRMENQRTTFVIKSSTLDTDEAIEQSVVSALSNDFETTSRRVLSIVDGRCSVSASVSIDLLYVDAKFEVPVALPFKVVTRDVVVLFDNIERCPVVEADEPGVGDSDNGVL